MRPISGARRRPLADLGISKQQSSDWQKLAAAPEEDFKRALATSERPTTAGIIATHTPVRPRDAVDPMALWVWGDFSTSS